ncbi:response regulator transcription factor [Nocardia sp. CA-107356]|uniref:response regulator transcription factor n=1 Tax=Nocardia sp. CA-107356 TaxID=3239972 RepID=UPI003D92D9B7
MRETTATKAALTARQAEVVTLVASGLTNQEIAGTLFVGVDTVKKHLTQALAVTGCQNRTQLALYWMSGAQVRALGAEVFRDSQGYRCTREGLAARAGVHGYSASVAGEPVLPHCGRRSIVSPPQRNTPLYPCELPITDSADLGGSTLPRWLRSFLVNKRDRPRSGSGTRADGRAGFFSPK